MSQETAVVKKPAGEVARESLSKTSTYEVIVKFHKSGRELIETFLLANMISVTISAAPNDEVLLAYCQFQGDIKTLDSKLASLRQSAMVVLGDKEEKFLDFFVALRQLSKPLPHLIPDQGRALSSLFSPDWVKGFLIALGLFIAWQGYHFLPGLISRAANPPPAIPTTPTPSVLEWNPYVLPEYHQAWSEVKKNHGLSDEMMITLFRMVKRIDKYGPGHRLRDLTIYP
ncbi:MAG: hypothetical protein ACE5JO_08095, partial [Candidatus Binatia bacterium]